MTTSSDLSQALLPAGPQPLAIGFDDSKGFEHLQRVAKVFSNSEMVPELFRGERGLPNSIIALELAHRMRMSALAVMQECYIVHGKPSWSAKFIIACLNSSGRFEALRFHTADLGKKTVEYAYWAGRGQEREKRNAKLEIQDKLCIAWTLPRGTKFPPNIATLAQAEAANLPVLKSPPVTIEMAVKEGWYTKADSKWTTMPELMLQYRAATFFGRTYAADLILGMQETQEVIDIEAVATPAEQPEKKITRPSFRKAVTVDAPAAAPAPEPEPKPAEPVAADPAAPPSDRVQLKELLESQGFGFDELLQWARINGQLTTDELVQVQDWDTLPEERCQRWNNARDGLVRGLRIINTKGAAQ